MITVNEGFSLIPNKGRQTHKTPQTTSIKDNKANSAEGRYFAPRLYRMSPDATKKP